MAARWLRRDPLQPIGETIEFYYMDTNNAAHFVAKSGSGHAIELTPVRQYPPIDE
jgi:hypothetical protein